MIESNYNEAFVYAIDAMECMELAGDRLAMGSMECS